MKKDMELTMQAGGTGAKAAISGYRIGGKTGTGQQGVKVGDGSEDLVLSFMGYLPADNPEYIILTVVDRSANYVDGNSLTLPMAKDMMEFIIRQKRIQPNNFDETNYALDDDTIQIDDYVGRGIAEVTNNLNYYGLTYDISGSGNVVKTQFPEGGTKVSKGSKVFITLEEDESNTELFMVPDITGMTIAQAEETIKMANLVPVVKDASIDNTEGAELTDEGSSTEETPTDEGSAEVSESAEDLNFEQGTVKTVVNQFPKYEIKVEANTEVIILVE
jgi:stage V sporulation protein D (sporulation-specific penicillin-binding protein)